MNDSSQLLDKLATIPKQTLDRLDPEYRDFILSQPAASLTPPHKIGWSPELRRAINSSTAGKGDAVPVGSTESFDLDNCTVLVFIPSGQTPKEGWPVYIYAHGGGFLFGTSRSEESFTTRVCADLRCVVVSVDYRLAPEHTFPAALDDVWDALLWVRKEGAEKLNVDMSRIAIGGYSTGGNLAAAITQRASMSQPPIRLLAQVLLMPSLDFTPTYDPETWSTSMREYAEVPGLWARDVIWSRDIHTPNIADRTRPDSSPLLQTQERAFENMAPTWIGVSELDVLRNDGESYAIKLQEHGVSVELKTYLGAAHLTAQADGVCELARRMRHDQIQFLKTALGT